MVTACVVWPGARLENHEHLPSTSWPVFPQVSGSSCGAASPSWSGPLLPWYQLLGSAAFPHFVSKMQWYHFGYPSWSWSHDQSAYPSWREGGQLKGKPKPWNDGWPCMATVIVNYEKEYEHIKMATEAITPWWGRHMVQHHLLNLPQCLPDSILCWINK